jgi:NhaC family Na+:H+ antiporter
MSENAVNAPRKATLIQALLVLLPTSGFLIFVTLNELADPHLPLIFGGILASILALTLGFKWVDVEKAIINMISVAMPAVLILMVVGMLIGTWIASGVVPSMIFYGLMIINPGIFLMVAFILCMLTSLAIGTSWGTAGTVGVALIGIGSGFGIPLHMVAGAVISGAYFGDKVSPISDTTVLNSVSTGTPLYEHILFMLRVTVPATIITIVLFLVVGLQYGGDGALGDVPALMNGLRDNFNISPILLIPPLFIIFIIAFKVPPLPGILIGSIISVPVFYIFQAGYRFDSMFDASAHILEALHYGFDIESGNEMIDSLLSRGGLDGKMWTISRIICAMIFGGVMEKTGCLEAITQSLIKFAKGIGSLTLVSLLSAVFGNIITADQYLSVILPGRMYRVAFIKRGYATKNLSRALESGGTLTSALIPWNTCGAYMIATLGIAAWTYVPFTFFHLTCIALTLIYAFCGISVAKITEEEQKELLANVEQI